MKIIISTLLLISFSCMGQYPIQKAYWDSGTSQLKIMDTEGILYGRRSYLSDTIPCFLLVCDTQPINGKTDTHVYWVKGYKVIEDFDTYYLDISKRRFGSSVIVWLDQNLK